MQRALLLLVPLGPVVRLELPSRMAQAKSWPGQKALAGRLPTSICPTAARRCSGKPASNARGHWQVLVVASQVQLVWHAAMRHVVTSAGVV